MQPGFPFARVQTGASISPIMGLISASPGIVEDDLSSKTGSRRLRAPWKTGGAVSAGPARLLLEVLFWGTGLLLIAVYFGATIGFENERREGIASFARAQAAASNPRDSGSDGVAVPPSAVRGETPAQPVADRSESLPIALLRIPGIGLEVPVFDDISERNLSRGAGWIPGTASPNGGGNMAVAAHRDQYFRGLKDVAVGDLLELESLSGPRNYRVESLTIVEPEDLWPLDPAEVDTVTLVTCYPFYFVGSAPQRYIVQAVAID